MELTIPAAKPSRIFHDVCAYWLTSSSGFRAKAQVQHASRTSALLISPHYLSRESIGPYLDRGILQCRVRVIFFGAGPTKIRGQAKARPGLSGGDTRGAHQPRALRVGRGGFDSSRPIDQRV